MNALVIAVDDRAKSLRFGEMLTAGSQYAVSVEGGAAAVGADATLALQIGGVMVALCARVNGAGTLSLMTQELADAVGGMRPGVRVPAFAAIRSTTDSQNVAVGKADIITVSDGWLATQTLDRVVQKGDKGDKGDTGDKGADGKNAYEIAVDNGFTGTVVEWLASLKGADGADGRDGVDGKDGADGRDGVDGKDGKDGKDGVDGKDGADGVGGGEQGQQWIQEVNNGLGSIAQLQTDFADMQSQINNIIYGDIVDLRQYVKWLRSDLKLLIENLINEGVQLQTSDYEVFSNDSNWP